MDSAGGQWHGRRCPWQTLSVANKVCGGQCPRRTISAKAECDGHCPQLTFSRKSPWQTFANFFSESPRRTVCHSGADMPGSVADPLGLADSATDYFLCSGADIRGHRRIWADPPEYAVDKINRILCRIEGCKTDNMQKFHKILNGQSWDITWNTRIVFACVFKLDI